MARRSVRPRVGAASAPGGDLRALLGEGLRRLEAAGLPTARQDAERLLSGLCGIDRVRLYTDRAAVEGERRRAYRTALARRIGGEPVQYLLGREEFCGLELRVTPAVLIPRPETELLAEWTLAELPPAAMVADVGTGSGCLAIALAVRRADTRVIAVDASRAALRVAAENVRRHGVEGQVQLVGADLLEPMAAPVVDVVVANPPYIPTALLPRLPREVRAWEPGVALDGGPDGMALHRRLIAAAVVVLRPGGALLLEMGDGQAAELTARMGAAGFVDVIVRRDLGGTERYIRGRKPRRAAGGP